MIETSLHIKKEILTVLNYFDFFKFPLRQDEIQKFLALKISQTYLKEIIDEMVTEGDIHKIKGCYLLTNSAEQVKRKLTGYDLHKKKLKRAKIVAGIIHWFPFVRMVAVSGSLSKGYADKTTDIDFFIVTKDEQLWTCRSLLHLLKKLSFLFNLQHSFCMNYFIGEKHLHLEEKNYFTAVELATLIPQKGKAYYQKLMSQNTWMFDYLPNATIAEEKNIRYTLSLPKKLAEKLFSSEKLNNWFMNLTNNRWKKKWKERGYPEEDYDLAFKTKLYVSKNHAGNFQKKVLNHIDAIALVEEK